MIRSPVSNVYERPQPRKRFCADKRKSGQATVLITRATRSNMSAISLSPTISGGVSAMVSPVARMTRFSS